MMALRKLLMVTLLLVVPSVSQAIQCTGSSAEGNLDQVCRPADGRGGPKAWFKRFFGSFESNVAIVVGVSDYDQFADLPTKNDAIRMRDYLLEEAGFDYVHTLTGSAVTKQRLDELMEDEFPSIVKKSDRFVFYWSGHGITRKNSRGGTLGYLPVKSSPKSKYSTMIAMDDIARWDDLIEAHQVLYLLDSCFSGLAGIAPKSNLQELAHAQLAGPSRHVMTAGTGDEQAIALDMLGGSLFTHAVLKGLRGAADLESGGYAADKLISIGELKHFVALETEFQRQKFKWNKTITPQVRDLANSSGAFFFTIPGKLPKLSEPNAAAEISYDTPAQPKSELTIPINLTVSVIKEVQERLATLGHRVGGIDGIFGPRTEQAVRNYQQTAGLIADGNINQSVIESLRISVSDEALSTYRAKQRELRRVAAEKRQKAVQAAAEKAALEAQKIEDERALLEQSAKKKAEAEARIDRFRHLEADDDGPSASISGSGSSQSSATSSSQPSNSSSSPNCATC